MEFAHVSVKTIEWRAGSVRMIDQRLLPVREVIRTYRDYRGVAKAIRSMVIRGAPAIGVAAAMGVALGLKGYSGKRARMRFALFSVHNNRDCRFHRSVLLETRMPT